jgi:inosine/xanthosine triphosphatase
MIIFVGSTNPVKIEATRLATKGKWQDLEIQGFEVASGVSHQPITDQETKQGAQNRAKAALAEGLQKFPDKIKEHQEILGIGLEGGVKEGEDGQLWSTVWGVVVDQAGQYHEANGASFVVPEPFASKIRQGGEMGPVVQAFTGIQNIKHKHGLIGVLTQEFVNRTEEYAAIAALALGIWYGRKWQSLVSLTENSTEG